MLYAVPMAKPPPPLPMPVELVTDAAPVRVLGNVAHSAVWQLCLAYWQGECRPLPSQPADRQALARISAAGWARHEVEIEAAVALILPLLNHARETHLLTTEAKRARSARAYATRRLQNKPMPHELPNHISKRRKGGATVEQVVAQAALEQAGLGERQPTSAELRAGAMTVRGQTVDVRAATRSDVRPSGGMTGTGTGAASRARTGLVDTATRR